VIVAGNNWHRVMAAEVSPVDFVQYGVLGLVVLAILTGWLWAKPSVDRLLEDKKRAEDQRDQFVKIYGEMLPVLTEVNDRLSKFADRERRQRERLEARILEQEHDGDLS
jgi:hypothetical protein